MSQLSEPKKQATDYCERCNKWEKTYPVKGRMAEVFACGYQVYYQAGTIRKQATTPFEKWVTAFHLLDKDPSLPVARLAKTIGVNWRTARRIKVLILRDIEDAALLLAY